jgi:hypothetical protein
MTAICANVRTHNEISCSGFQNKGVASFQGYDHSAAKFYIGERETTG